MLAYTVHRLLAFRVGHGVAQHCYVDGAALQDFFQPGDVAACFDGKLSLQNLLPGKEQHLVMSVTKQTRE